MLFTTYIRGSIIRFHINIIPSAFDLHLSIPHIVPHIEDEARLWELCPKGYTIEVHHGYLHVLPK